MRFAAPSARFLNYLLLLILPIIALTLIGRFLIVDITDATDARIATFASLFIPLLFSFRLGQSLFDRLTKGESVWQGFKERMNQITFLCVLAIIGSTCFWLTLVHPKCWSLRSRERRRALA